MPPTRKLLTLLATATLLVACGDDDDVEAGSGDATATACDAIEVTGAVGESASITVPDDCQPTELLTVDLEEGDGAEAPAGATVTVHYAGVLLDGTQFDSSFDRGQTATFPLDGVISGWTEGIPGMKVGGRRLLVIPSEMAYGAAGRPPIPPDSPLVFVVDLLGVA